MPKRTDIRTILVLGSGPIVIGQGCEFDYSGAQACKTLKAEGYRIVLVNSNPATIMTDPAFSDRTYIEPITPEAVRKIIRKEAQRGPRIDAILPTLGGQTALNCACALWDDGTLQEHGIQMIGANREVIHRAEDRQIFKDICASIGLKMPKARTVKTVEDGLAFLEEIGLPAICRPAFTLGGTGGGIAYNKEEFKDLLQRGLAASMIGQVQIDQSVIGWKEYELEVVRDKKDNCIIVCGIENIDPMGVHTGDSVTVAPILTLTDKEYQAMRDAAIAIMRAVGVETGGSNVQFAVNPDPRPDPKTGRKPFEMVVVEMNPRVSRSSALASKATGFPIAKIAAKLAVGYTLDELKNDITGTTSACFEPTIDYIVTKMPRWTFEKFPEADETLTTQMKSVGEAMAIGRTFKESLQKVIRSMDVKRFGLGLDRNDKWLAAMRAVERDQLLLDVTPGAEPGSGSPNGLRTADGAPIEWPIPVDKLTRKLAVPSQGRLYYIRYALKMGWSIEKIRSLSRIDPFFLDQIAQLVEFEDALCSYKQLEEVPAETLFRAKQLGYSDAQLANLYLGSISPETILKVRRHRQSLAIEPVYKLVDTCAAEFEAITPYYYSTYERTGVEVPRLPGAEGKTPSIPGHLDTPSPSDEIRITDKKKVIILGGGPNRIGQGIEFDYCCCHAAFAARDLGFESVMINSNPETVSTDYDTSDLLFFEPLTLEDTLNVIERLNGAPLESPAVVDWPSTWAWRTRPPTQQQLDEWNRIRGGQPKPHAIIPASLTPALAASIERAVRKAGARRSIVLSYVSRTEGFEREVWTSLTILDDLGRVYECEVPAAADSEITLRRAVIGPAIEATLEDYIQYTLSDEDAAEQLRTWHRSSRLPGLVHGVIVQFGGQTPLNLAKGLVTAGAPIIGTSLDSIDLAEDRDRFDALLERLKLERPPSGIAKSIEEAVAIAGRLGYPVLLRPSYVLGGRGMEICPDETALRHFITTALSSSDLEGAPVLIDKFLDSATEVDVDVVADYATGHEGTEARRHEGARGTAVIAGVMEHIEHAGVHSGDSACTIPPWSLSPELVGRIEEIGRVLARELKVCGLMNLQLAIKSDSQGDHVYILEVNPRASRTVPFVSKAKHIPWPNIAARAMMGRSLGELSSTFPALKDYLSPEPRTAAAPAPRCYAVKESVFPFAKFPGVDVVLGPEMRSTGEVMGIDPSLPIAFAKSQLASGITLPTDPAKGGVFLSVRAHDRADIIAPARMLVQMGFTVYTTEGTGRHLDQHGVKTTLLQKIGAGARPNVLDLMQNGQISLIINTPTRTGWQTDEGRIRSTAVRLGIPMITTATAANAAARAIEALRAGDWGVAALQDYNTAPQRGPVPEVVVPGPAAARR